MGTTPIRTKIVLITIFVLIAIEVSAARLATFLGSFSYGHLGVLRVIESAIIIAIVLSQKEGLGLIGLDPTRLAEGIATGLRWSAAFALAAGAGLLGLYLFKYDPLGLIRVQMPPSGKDLIVFFCVGGIIAPIAEEIFFRGILFGYFNQWGALKAVILSTIIFVFFHPQAGLTQTIGGVVFALAYHFSRSLAAPIIIHGLGNLSLFMISFLSKGL